MKELRTDKLRMPKRKHVFLSVLILNLLFSALVASASTFDDLLKQEERPTIQQVIDANIDTSYKYPELEPIQDEKKRFGYLDFEKWNNTLVTNAPRFIATLEKSFPGATWAFIGRDANAIADVVEAFYLSIGQHGRVARIGMSEATMTNVNDQMLIKLLANSGFDFDHLHERHPYILVDAVSKGFGRQGRRILQAVYNTYGKLGRNISDLLEKVNMVGIIVSTFKREKNTPNPIEQKDDYIAKDRKEYLTSGGNLFRDSHSILTYDDKTTMFGESGYEHWSGSWHGSYGPITEKDGIATAQIGRPMPDLYKKAVLKFQKDTITKVNTPEFLQKVKDYARADGYEFPMQRPSPVVIEMSTMQDVVSEHMAKFAEKVNQNNLIAGSEPSKNLTKLDDIVAFVNQNGAEFKKVKLPLSVSFQIATKLGPKYTGASFVGVSKLAAMMLTWLKSQSSSSSAYASSLKMLEVLQTLLTPARPSKETALFTEDDGVILFWQLVEYGHLSSKTIAKILKMREDLPFIARALDANNMASFKTYQAFVKANSVGAGPEVVNRLNKVKEDMAQLKSLLNSRKGCSMLSQLSHGPT